MAYTITLASLSLSTHDAFALRSPKIHSSSLLPTSNLGRIVATFATGSPLSWTISHRRNCSCKATPVSVRCEQSTQGGNSLDVWLDRLAMVGFAVAISVEIATGKGLLEVENK